MTLSIDEIRRHLDGLTKPPKSLGRLEELAARLCLVQQTLSPVTRPRRLVLFAGDHGVVASGVSQWPSEITRLMIGGIREGGAASSVFARETSTDLVLVDVGALSDDTDDQGCAGGRDAPVRSIVRRVRAGTRNLADEPALTSAEFAQAVEVGAEQALAAAGDGMRVVIAGELGIGNTTPAACLAMLLADVPIAIAVGRGAGADDATIERKRSVVEKAVGRALSQWESDPTAAIASVCGLELAAMAGFFVAARAAGLTILLDGYVASSAALIAERLSPGVAQSMIAAHLSREPGHRRVLDRLGLVPFLEWDLCLGEGTGGLLLLGLLEAAAAMTGRMATLASLGISSRGDQ